MATFATHSDTEWILLTGQPGCGNTTAVKRLSEALARDGATPRVCDRGGARWWQRRWL